MKTEKDKAKCRECYWKGRYVEVLEAENPLDKDEIVSGCPQCKSVDTIESVCDEPGCWLGVSCSTPVKGKVRYRSTCGEHAP